MREFLSFKLGAEEYGIDILRVQEIRSYEEPMRIANAPAFIKGVVNLRGVIVPIVDMRLKFNLERAMAHCPNCGGQLKLIAAILEPPVIEKILTHLGLQADCKAGRRRARQPVGRSCKRPENHPTTGFRRPGSRGRGDREPVAPELLRAEVWRPFADCPGNPGDVRHG